MLNLCVPLKMEFCGGIHIRLKFTRHLLAWTKVEPLLSQVYTQHCRGDKPWWILANEQLLMAGELGLFMNGSDPI